MFQLRQLFFPRANMFAESNDELKRSLELLFRVSGLFVLCNKLYQGLENLCLWSN